MSLTKTSQMWRQRVGRMRMRSNYQAVGSWRRARSHASADEIRRTDRADGTSRSPNFDQQEEAGRKVAATAHRAMAKGRGRDPEEVVGDKGQQAAASLGDAAAVVQAIAGATRRGPATA